MSLKVKGMARHTGPPQWEAPVSVSRQKGARGKHKPQPLLGFPQARQGRVNDFCLASLIPRAFGVSRLLLDVWCLALG